MAKNYNTAPYFDDYFEEQADGSLRAKPFYKVLFKPGYAVQARELNQLQSILGHQIASMGNHFFKKNSLVIPGGVSLNKTADIVCLAGGDIEDLSVLVGKTITNAPSFTPTDFNTLNGYIIAIVIAVKEASGDDPAALYVQYRQSQDDRNTFIAGETLYTVEEDFLSFDTHGTLGSTVGKAVTIENGVFYTKELFVDAFAQSIIVEIKPRTTNCTVGLNVVESEVTAADDETLYDNATGAPNEYAPGADRYKIELTLARFDVNSTTDDDNFIRLITIENDTITYLNDSTQYAYLMDTLAHRTFDANGNFVVRGLKTSIAEAADDNYVSANVSKGKCYLGGYEYNQIADHKVAILKPRGEEYQQIIPNQTIYPSRLTYFYVAGDAQSYCVPGNVVQLIPTSPHSSSLSVATDCIGTAIFRGIEYFDGRSTTSPDPDNIYRIFVDDVSMSPGWTVQDVGGIRFLTTPLSGYFSGVSVLHELSVSNVVGDFIVGETLEGNSAPTTALTTSDAAGSINEYTVTFSNLIDSSMLNQIRQGWKVTGTNVGPDAYVRSITSNSVVLTDYNTGTVSGALTFSNPQSGYIYSTNSVQNKLYVRKDTPAAVPAQSSVKSVQSGAIQTATLDSSFVTNYSPGLTPFVQLDKNPFVSLQNVDTDIIRTDFYTLPVDPVDDYQVQFSVDGGLGDALPNSDQFRSASAKNFWLYLPDEDRYIEARTANGVRVQFLSAPLARQDYIITFYASDHPTHPWEHWNQDVIVYATVNLNDAQSINKDATTVNVAIPTPSDSWMALSNQDVFDVEKIVEGRTVNITNASWSAGTATVTIEYTRKDTEAVATHIAGNVVVIRDVVSDTGDNPATAGEYYKVDPFIPDRFAGYAGFNGKHTLTIVGTPSETAPSGGLVTVTVDLSYALADDPGTFDTGSTATVALAPDINRDTDITNRYIWDSGNTAFTLGTGTIKKKSGSVSPIGQLGVRYSYYDMDVNDGGAFVSVDSYSNGVDFSYIGDIQDITDPTGNKIKVRSCLDFRTRLSRICMKNIASVEAGSNVIKLKDLNVSAWEDDLVGSFILGPTHGALDETEPPGRIDLVSFNPETGDTELYINYNGAFGYGSDGVAYPAAHTVEADTYFIGLGYHETGPDADQFTFVDPDFGGKMIQYPKGGARLRYSFNKFLPRNLMLFVKRDQQNLLSLDSLDVSTVNDLKKYVRDATKLPLAYIHMEPYTLTVNDVVVTPFAMPVYQMVDIDQIKQRVDGIEYSVSLALDRDLDSAISNAGDSDDNFSNAQFWNEDFMDFRSQDYESDDFKCTVYDKSYVAPGTITKSIGLQLAEANTTEWVKSGSVVTLPYTEERAFGNTAASSYSNLNPFNRIQWEGKMRLYPSVDNWIDVTGNPPPVGGGDPGTQVPFPPLPTDPPYTVPSNPVAETVTDINIIAKSWGPDSDGGKHAITFEWKTSKGRTGRVNTDIHLSPAIRKHGARGYDGTFATSLINRKYNTEGVKEYLQAGQHFDQKSPEDWKN